MIEEEKQKRIRSVNIGKLRSVIYLYFPNCIEYIDNFDQLRHKNTIKLQEFKEDKKDLVHSINNYIAIDNYNYINMCNRIQEELKNMLRKLVSLHVIV